MFNLAYSVFYVLFIASFILILNNKSWGRRGYDYYSSLHLKHYIVMIMFFVLGVFKLIIVDTDSENYYLMYEDLVSYGRMHFYLAGNEVGYKYLNVFFAWLGMPYYVFFGFITLITWSLYIISGSRVPSLIPWMLYFSICAGYLLWSFNGVRQMIAVMFFSVSLIYIIEKKPYKYCCCIILAMLFHKSAAMLLPLYFIRSFKFHKNIFLCIYAVSILCIWIGLDYRLNLLDDLLKLVLSNISILDKYNQYLGGRIFTSNIEEASSTGLGVLLRLMTGFYIIIFCQRVLYRYPQLEIYYVLYFAGLILSNLFFSIEAIGRIIQYTNILLGILLSATIYTSRTSVDKLISLLVLLAYLVLFIVSLNKAIIGKEVINIF